MKILLFLLVTIFSINLNAQLELKGLVLGNTYQSDIYEQSTLGGIDGIIVGSTLNDGRLYSIIFICGGELIGNIYKENRISFVDVNKLVLGLESKYNISFNKSEDSKGEDIYRCKSSGYQYCIMTDHNPYMEPTTKCTVYVWDEALDKINDKEEQTKANLDF